MLDAIDANMNNKNSTVFDGDDGDDVVAVCVVIVSDLSGVYFATANFFFSEIV